ncbi:MAG: hypothetical protein IPM54_35575 [Polyangiaceae bacterium]|nr:hypothetical protein [Polyangiaceae bacterium]
MRRREMAPTVFGRPLLPVNLAARVCDVQAVSGSGGCTLAGEPAVGAALILGMAAALMVGRRIGLRRR